MVASIPNAALNFINIDSGATKTLSLICREQTKLAINSMMGPASVCAPTHLRTHQNHWLETNWLRVDNGYNSKNTTNKKAVQRQRLYKSMNQCGVSHNNAIECVT